jgi:radical SAM superfamily enzyme YgiQ (UPF0313 family)
MMATFIRNRGYSVAIVDAEAEDLTPEQAAQRVGDMDPTLVALVVYGHQPSASTQNMAIAGEICTSLKNNAPRTQILMVGGHVAALPGRTLQEEETDFVATGEGPYTILELLQSLGSSTPDLSKVRGLCYWEGRTIRSNPPAPLVKDLASEIPQLAWDLLPMEKYRAHNWHCFGGLQRQPYAAIYTTLGCPYHCTFCCIQAPFKNGEGLLGYKESVNSYRFWSPQSVIAQIDRLVDQYGVRNLKIADEMFVLNKKHVLGICDLIIERGYDLNIWAYARVDTVKEGMIEKLKRAGFNWLCLGIEAASERVRDDVQKGYAQEDVSKTVEAIRAAGINVLANFIFGLPEDDLDSMQQTLDLALELNCEFANFYSTMGYPGSQLYNLAVKEAWPLPEKWSGYSQHSVDTLPLPTKHLSGPEVLRFRDQAWQVYFNSPRYLDMITRKFGPETSAHVREMAGHQLVRRYVSGSHEDVESHLTRGP